MRLWLPRADIWPRKLDEDEAALATRQRHAALRGALGFSAIVVVVRAIDALAGR